MADHRRRWTDTRDAHMPLKVFVGYDFAEAPAYHVLAASIMRHASRPVSITALSSRQIAPYTRARSATQATDFSFTRFMVPYLCGYEGMALFMDCDMLVQADIDDVFAYARNDTTKSVWCCQHDYTPSTSVKFLGNEQKAYPRKNWSSFLLFRNDRCQSLTPAYVNGASAADLHRLAWVADEQIGSLPITWNWLVGEYSAKPDAKNLHWTVGGPWFEDYANTDHADIWRRAAQEVR